MVLKTLLAKWPQGRVLVSTDLDPEPKTKVFPKESSGNRRPEVQKPV